MKINELHNQPVKPDTYEASMALNQLLKIGKHAIKLHNLIKDDAEMEAWVAKKIDLAGDYVKSVHGYMQGENNNLYDDGGLTEDAPFGSGFDLLRMAIMKKFISVQEWDLLKDKWKGAATEIEQRYDDWPEGEGFGSSDHNFAIKELMELVGYEFDDKDTSGRFVVTKQPVEIEKAGIKNARMKDAMPTEDGSSHTSMNKYGLSAREHKGKFYSYKNGKLTGAFDSMKELAKHQEELIKDESVSEDAGEKIANMAQNMTKDEFMSHADELGLTPEEAAEHYEKMSGGAHAGKFEDAGNMDLIGDGAENLGLDPNKFDYYYDTSGAGYGEVRTKKSGKTILQFEYDRDGDAEVSMDNKTIANIKQGEQLPINVISKLNMMKEDADVDAQFKSDVLQFLNSKVVQIEKQIELAPANTPEEKENKEFALKLFNFVQAKLEQKDNGDNTITVPKSFKKD